jgi:hypothetical protein
MDYLPTRSIFRNDPSHSKKLERSLETRVEDPRQCQLANLALGSFSMIPKAFPSVSTQ